MAGESRTHGVGSARRVLQILLQFTEQRPTATVEELAAAVDASVGSTYRYLSLLKELALIEEKSRGQYTVSPRVFSLSRAASAARDIASAARTTLVELAETTGETALLVRQLGDSIVCVDTVEAPQQMRLSFSPGELLPMHRGASAKVMLASLRPQKRRAYLQRMAGELSDEGRAALEAELERIHAEGFAESSAEVDEGVWAVAAPITAEGRVVAAISVAAPGFRVALPRRDQIRADVQAAAIRVSGNLEHVLL